MINAFVRAIGQLDDPRILRLLGVSALIGVAAFVLAWIGIGWVLTETAITEIGWLDTTIDVLGGLATLVLTWFTFPLVLSACVCLFLENVAAAVEARHYPDLPKAPGLPWTQALVSSVRFLAAVILFNALLLPLWLFAPLYPVAYIAVNGLLVGREYFELVALRRSGPQEARELRRKHGGEVFAMGLVTAAMLTVPFLNLIAPVIGTAAMVHRVHAWRRTAGHAGGSGGG